MWLSPRESCEALQVQGQGGGVRGVGKEWLRKLCELKTALEVYYVHHNKQGKFIKPFFTLTCWSLLRNSFPLVSHTSYQSWLLHLLNQNSCPLKNLAIMWQKRHFQLPLLIPRNFWEGKLQSLWRHSSANAQNSYLPREYSSLKNQKSEQNYEDRVDRIIKRVGGYTQKDKYFFLRVIQSWNIGR